MTKKYRLLHSISDLKEGEYGQFDEVSNSYKFFNGTYFRKYTKDMVENTPQWFEEVKEIIPNPELIQSAIKLLAEAGYDVRLMKDKEEVEEIINEWRNSNRNIIEILNSKNYSQTKKLITERESLQREQDAFEQSRLTNPLGGFKYDTFSDYKNNQKQ